MRITLITGLPGSGKTTFGYRLAVVEGALLIDEMKFDTEIKVEYIHAVNPEHLIIVDQGAAIAGPQLVIQRLLKWFPHDTVVADGTKFVGRSLTEQDFNFILFENDPEACLVNLMKRNDSRFPAPTLDMLKAYSSYNPSEWPNATIMPVYKE
jgi:adenylate kinase family enzyme